MKTVVTCTHYIFDSHHHDDDDDDDDYMEEEEELLLCQSLSLNHRDWLLTLSYGRTEGMEKHVVLSVIKSGNSRTTGYSVN